MLVEIGKDFDLTVYVSMELGDDIGKNFISKTDQMYACDLILNHESCGFNPNWNNVHDCFSNKTNFNNFNHSRVINFNHFNRKL